MPLSRQSRLPGELAAVAYMAGIALLAQSTRASVFLFPELGALAFGVCVFPRGAWARTPSGRAVLGASVMGRTPRLFVERDRGSDWSQLGDGPLTAALAMAWGR